MKNFFRVNLRIYPRKSASTNKGFTLIEILTAITVFSIIIASALGIFIGGLRGQRRALASQQLLDQTSYVVEYMSRSLRMARKELNAPNCLSQNGLNYELINRPNEKGIRFITYKGECQEFFLDTLSSRLKESKDGNENYLTSEKLEVTSFKIGPSSSWTQADDEQPRVTFLLKIKAKQPIYFPEIKLQATVSQRNPDVRK